ncbi:DcaP family trimeric outer membrane transporter [Acinetobacter nosocomialis]|uniref:DcaP family trimeric outer membrane transporter n=1 Tax=Acinetobacter calcoaceticus/baumannii complex TaxID=909768 RepID=UPI0021BEB6F1|nr:MULTISPECIES: DcaP family trimeric outer membrane transporter [Acinetobacter calcoaceticus/baumannii complex]MCT9283955.1 TMF family protein [Acinetobacter baumannii]MCU4554530.1 TMF family protein [Acinetobacter nosocomialis]MDH2532071.1 DcaP family trimeric outer membrane transporter [Acinetobacter baumannii]
MSNLTLTVQKTVLAGTIITCMSTSYAQQADTEVQQLRQEVQELRALLQTSIQQSQVIQASPVVVASAKPTAAAKPAKSFVTPSGTEVDFYGYIRADASYQAEGASTMFNNINGVPLENTSQAAEQKDRLRTTMAATRFGFNFKTPTAIGDVGGKLEMDFFGGSTRDQFRIRHAYLTSGNWLVGQTWSNFIAPEYLPETVEAATYVGGSLQRTPLVKYTKSLTPQTNFAISIEDPKYTDNNGSAKGTDPGTQMRLPAVVGRVNHKFGNGSIISGRSFVAEKKTAEDENWAWGVGLGGKYQMTPKTMLKADYYHVKGDGRMLFWANQGYMLDDQKQMHTNEFDVISTGITQQLTPKLRSTIGFGYMQAKDDNEFSRLVIKNQDETQNKKLWQGWINAFYNPYKPVNFGVEYGYGERETFNGKTGIDNRINITAIYDF